MASFFLWLLSCCLGGGSEDKGTSNERTGLLESRIDEEGIRPDILANGDVNSFDQAKYEERLQDIVTAKKGAMVDVASPYPFNLRNKPKAVLEAMMQDHSGSSTSRSASTSTFRDAHPPRYYHPTASMAAPTHSQSVIDTSSAGSHADDFVSRSHSPSFRTCSPPPGIDQQNGLPTLSGILNVRLVNNRQASREAANERRGRSKLKKSAEAGVAGDFVISTGMPYTTSLAGEGPSDICENTVHDTLAEMAASTHHTPSPGSSPWMHSSHRNPASLASMRVQDIGPICMSWPE